MYILYNTIIYLYDIMGICPCTSNTEKYLRFAIKNQHKVTETGINTKKALVPESEILFQVDTENMRSLKSFLVFKKEKVCLSQALLQWKGEGMIPKVDYLCMVPSYVEQLFRGGGGLYMIGHM